MLGVFVSVLIVAVVILSSFPWLETFWNCWFPTDACDSLRARISGEGCDESQQEEVPRGHFHDIDRYWQNHLFLLIADFRVLATLPNVIQDAETIETDWLILYTADKVILKHLLIKYYIIYTYINMIQYICIGYCRAAYKIYICTIKRILSYY